MLPLCYYGPTNCSTPRTVLVWHGKQILWFLLFVPFCIDNDQVLHLNFAKTKFLFLFRFTDIFCFSD